VSDSSPTGLAEINRLVKIASDAGWKVDTWDYGWSNGAHLGEKNVLISEVYRSERDGYIGSKVICEDVLREALK
jgi:hypothetical protein